MKFYTTDRGSYFTDRHGRKFQVFRTIHNVWGEINENGKIEVYDSGAGKICTKYANSGIYIETLPLWPHYQIIIPD